MATTDPRPRESAAQRIETALIDEISVGRIAPGERLDETRIALRFGASRTPVREALNRMLAQGILVSGERRGVRVAEYSHEELAQMFEAMYEIEAACARMAAQRMTLLGRSRLEAAHAGCIAAAETGDIPTYLRANEAFHLTIYDAIGNRFIAELALDFRKRTGPFRAKRFRTRDDLIASAQSHQEIVDSIVSADRTTAEAGMRSHLSAAFLQVLAAN